MKSRLSAAVFVVAICLLARPAVATQFKTGSLIIPMDTDYQPLGILKAHGLLYQLLKADVPVHWVIKAQKLVTDVDFTATSQDLQTGALITSHGYRGGPFVVEYDDVAKATPVITAWHQTSTTTVHVAQQDFVGRTARLLTAAPTIAVIADGNEGVAFGYLNAAGIPDRVGGVWNKNSPDVLSIAQVAGPTTTKHDDGALFRPSGQPNYCQIMTMHWGVKQVVDEVVAEYRAFLGFPTHMMAECQAVNAIENSLNGKFLTTTGFLIDNNINKLGPFAFLNSETPFAQMDGPFELVGGSERAYTLPPGGKYYDSNIVMIKDASTPLGVRSIWMTGYLDGKCLVGGDEIGGGACMAGVGKVSYLGGHEYGVKVPINNKNAATQGTRLFLNSLFEASCTTFAGQPLVMLTKSGPATTSSSTVTYTLTYYNLGLGAALDFELQDVLPPGSTFVSATKGGTLSGNTVTWKLGDLPSNTMDSVELTVSFPSYGSYNNAFSATYTIGVNTKTELSNQVTTLFKAPTPDLGPPLLDGGPMYPDSGSPPLDGGMVGNEGGMYNDGLVPPDSAATVPDGAPVVPDTGVAQSDSAPVAPDSAVTVPDSAPVAPDLAVTVSDTAVVVSDTGVALPDVGGTVADSGGAVPDAGGTVADSGGAVPDAGGATVDQGPTAPDAGTVVSDVGGTGDKGATEVGGDFGEVVYDLAGSPDGAKPGLDKGTTDDTSSQTEMGTATELGSGTPDAGTPDKGATTGGGGDGGCDCNVGRADKPASLLLFVLLGIALVARRRRRGARRE